mmetsp:Transcript_7907/g.18521  ORF Transcript_7907/g.18521 Transcript_7907/m.18521 type:complete len:685 (+) Transcript_7907:75-2129(+)
MVTAGTGGTGDIHSNRSGAEPPTPIVTVLAHDDVICLEQLRLKGLPKAAADGGDPLSGPMSPVNSWALLVDLLAVEDTQLEATLQQEQQEFQEWAQRQDAILNYTITQQKEVEEQLSTLKRHMEKEQVHLDRVVREVRVILNEYRAMRPNETVGPDVRPPRSFSANPFGGGTDPASSATTAESDEIVAVPEEPEAVPLLKQMVTHIYFDAISAFVIFVNAIFVGVTLERQVQFPGRPQEAYMKFLETFFLGFYCLELTLKLIAHQLSYFFNEEWRWNLFDLVLVIVSVYDFVSETLYVARTGNRTSLLIMKLLRLLKMLRMLHVVRLMRFFRELRLMLYSIVRSFRSLFWAVLMLSLIMYMFGLCFMQGGLVYIMNTKDWSSYEIENSDSHLAKVKGIEDNWGNIALSIESLFMAITGGKDWWEFSESFNPFDSEAADEVTIVYYLLFLLYIAFLSFAVLNTLTGIFVDASFDAAQNDHETVIQTALEMEKANIKDISRVFGLIDEDRNSVITFEEFEAKLSSPEVRAYFARLDIDATEARELFDVLSSPVEGSNAMGANGTGHNLPNGHNSSVPTSSEHVPSGGGRHHYSEHHTSGYRCVSLDEFAEGLKKVKGPARSMDMVSLRIDARRYSQELRNFMVFVETYFGHLRNLLERRLGGPLVPQQHIMPLSERLLQARQHFVL